ncbi:hypothetical protein F511_08795 [Dorcoceras hygrometricum]|uniref:Phytocyanin domain-containing protein n=1 Tax=Dorcoceras hygrometricum TaxID=472368 RepID=A0A2Z7AK03_9LAMI|nr:hypothetical protein F511_08795 [Dorcoceras hygrometricum]
MASKAFLMAILVAVIFAPTLATDHIVGDEGGWKLGVNYTAWAMGKEFRLGDTLTFTYREGSHNVLRVNGSDFKQCLSTNTSVLPLSSGNDVITLATPGKKWYICGIGGHCSQGMQLSITVDLVDGPTPAPTAPTPGTSAASMLKATMWMLTAMAAYKLIMA